MNDDQIKTDFLIIGSGLAGLFAAYNASKYGRVTVITKSDYKESSSWYAQGGIAVALSRHDSPELHYKDTITAGRGLCSADAVKILVSEGKQAVNELIGIGMEFDKRGSEILFGLEGGHSRRRVIHASGSATGQQVVKFLVDIISEIPNVDFRFNTQAVKLISNGASVEGVQAINFKTRTSVTVRAKSTILASGGYSRIYSRSTNPDSSVGEGVWLARNTGAEIRDMEFVQFHPTSFYSASEKTFLVSEAVRGEGAYLLNSNGERFMSGYHELLELAPRDVVSKAISGELKRTDSPCVYLDLRHLDAGKIKDRFFNIYRMLSEFGLDMTRDLIPVAPAAHYAMGGIKTDVFGRTNLSNLYACGECSSTGVHGANRLASNSLLECLVFAKRAVKAAAENIDRQLPADYSGLDELTIDESKIETYGALQNGISCIMNVSAGIVRTPELLKDALDEIKNLLENAETSPEYRGGEYYHIVSKGLLNLCAMILSAAYKRTESRGGHQREDYPNSDDKFLGHFTFLNDTIKFEELNGKGENIAQLGETFN